MKILIVTKNWLGDLFFQLPAIEVIRRCYPEAEIICMSPSRCREILDRHPGISRTIIFDEKKEHRFFLKRWFFFWQLSKEKFDRAYLFHTSKTRAMMTWLSRIPVRIGYAADRKFWLTQAISEPMVKMHQVDYFLNLVEAADGIKSPQIPYQFHISEKDRIAVSKKLVEIKMENFCVFHLGANWEPKRWPVSHFARLADLLAEQTKLSVILTGGSQDVPLGDSLCRSLKTGRVISWIGKTNLGELGALFERSQFVVSGDSGPMHMASGVGARVAAIFGPTDPDLTGPRGTGKTLLFRYVPKGFQIPWYGSLTDLPPEGWLSGVLPETVFESLSREGWLSVPIKGGRT